MISETEVAVVEPAVEESVIFAGDYINKLSGEQIENECKRRLNAGCKELTVNFSKTEIINSIGISILLGMIDSASNNGARIIFADVNEHTLELFDLLGVSKHITLA